MTVQKYCISAFAVLFHTVFSFSNPISVDYINFGYSTFIQTSITDLYVDQNNEFYTKTCTKTCAKTDVKPCCSFGEEVSYFYDSGTPSESGYARASSFAGKSSVNVNTSSSSYSADNSAIAEASLTTSFSTVYDEVQPIQFKLYGWAEAFFSCGEISITDLTTDYVVWEYGWEWLHGGWFGPENDGITLNPYDPLWIEYGKPRSEKTLSVTLNFLNDHMYKIAMFTHVDSNDDDEIIVMRMSGFEPITCVPEPGTILLLVCGICFLFSASLQKKIR